MKPPSGRIFNRSVKVSRSDWGRDSAGGRARIAERVSMLAAAAQPLSAEATPEHLREAGKTAWQVLFAADPGVKSGDRIEVMPEGPTLSVDATANDEGGRGACFTVVCVETS